MRTIVIVLSACLISAGSFAADQTSTGANSKLAAMLAAKDANGKPIISPEEQAYFSGLNDNLRALLDDLVQKEVITRPEHLATLLGLQLRPQKMEVLLQNRCVLCHTDSESQSADNLFSVASSSRQPAADCRALHGRVRLRGRCRPARHVAPPCRCGAGRRQDLRRAARHGRGERRQLPSLTTARAGLVVGRSRPTISITPAIPASGLRISCASPVASSPSVARCSARDICVRCRRSISSRSAVISGPSTKASGE